MTRSSDRPVTKLLIVLHHRFELWNAPPWFPEKLQQEFPELEVIHLGSYEGIEQHLHDAEIVITWSLRPEQFKAASKLRWIHSPAAAVHQLIFPELVESQVILTNAREVHGPVVAEPSPSSLPWPKTCPEPCACSNSMSGDRKSCGASTLARERWPMPLSVL